MRWRNLISIIIVVIVIIIALLRVITQQKFIVEGPLSVVFIVGMVVLGFFLVYFAVKRLK